MPIPMMRRFRAGFARAYSDDWSMVLQNLRKGASGWIAKLFLILLVFSFLIWGIADVFKGMSETDVATVGKTQIPAAAFRQRYLDQVQQLGQRAGRGITPDEARAFGLDRRLLNQMIADATLDEKASQMKLAVSNEELVRLIHENPAYRAPGAAAFDPAYFAQLLRSNGMTEPRFLAAERQRAMRQQLVAAFGEGITAPKTLVQALERYEGEVRNVSYIVVTPAAAGPLPAPTPEQLRSYFDENKISFRAPEYRKIALIALTPDEIAGKLEVSDEDARAAYEVDTSRFGTAEKREVHQIMFSKPEDAAAAVARAKAGASFADIAAAQGLKPEETSLGLVEKSGMLDPQVAEAAFTLEPGSVSEPVSGRFGSAVLHVSRVEPASLKPFDEVKGALKQEIAMRRAETQLLDAHDALEDDRASGSTLAEIAQKQGLRLQTFDAIDRSGRTPDGTPAAIPGGAPLITEAFNAAPGIETETVQLPQNAGFIWFETLDITPARDRDFDEVKDAVAARWTEQETAKAVAAKAAALLARAESGVPLAQVAGEAELPLRIADGMRRGRTDGIFSTEAVDRVFEVKEHGFGEVQSMTAPDHILFQVSQVIAPQVSAEDDQRVVNELSQQMENDILLQYLGALQKQIGVQVNERALAQTVGAGTGN